MTDDRDEILARIDLRDLWPELVGPRKPGAGWPCPNPQHAQTGASPPVNIFNRPTGGQGWKCHGCDASGTAVDLVVLVHGVDVAEAFTRLRSLAGIPQPERRPDVDLYAVAGVEREPRRLPAGVDRGADLEALVAATPATPSDRAAAEAMATFCTARSWRLDVAARFGLVGVVDDRGAFRLRFPFRAGGRVVWWQDRKVDGGEPYKYLAPTGQPAQLYALDLADSLEAIAGAGVAIVVEGPTDAVALAHVDGWAELVLAVPGAASGVWRRIGPMVAAVAPGAEVVVIGDADPAGDRFRGNLLEALGAHGLRPVACRPPDGLDVDEWRRHAGSDDRFADELLAELHDVGAVAA